MPMGNGKNISRTSATEKRAGTFALYGRQTHLFVNSHYFANPFGDEIKQIQPKHFTLMKIS